MEDTIKAKIRLREEEQQRLKIWLSMRHFEAHHAEYTARYLALCREIRDLTFLDVPTESKVDGPVTN